MTALCSSERRQISAVCGVIWRSHVFFSFQCVFWRARVCVWNFSEVKQKEYEALTRGHVLASRQGKNALLWWWYSCPAGVDLYRWPLTPRPLDDSQQCTLGTKAVTFPWWNLNVPKQNFSFGRFLHFKRAVQSNLANSESIFTLCFCQPGTPDGTFPHSFKFI